MKIVTPPIQLNKNVTPPIQLNKNGHSFNTIK